MFGILYESCGVDNLIENMDHYENSGNVPYFNDPFDPYDIRAMIGRDIELEVLRVIDKKVPFESSEEYYIEMFEYGWEYFMDSLKKFVKKADKGSAITKRLVSDRGSEGELAFLYADDVPVAEILGELVYFVEHHGFSKREINEILKVLKK